MSRPLLSPLHFLKPRQTSSFLRTQLRSRLRPQPTRLLASRHTSLRTLSTSTHLRQQTQAQNSAPYQSQHEKPPNKATSKNEQIASSNVFIQAVAIACLFPLIVHIVIKVSENPEQNDAPPSAAYPVVAGRKGVKGAVTDNEDHPIEQIPTGTSTVPFFPRKIYLPSTPSSSPTAPSASPALPAGLGAAAETEEYVLLGLGVRTVSFLSIQVYVVGLYVAKSDLARLQESMIHIVASGSASTLVENEKKDLKKMLLDAKGSEKAWGETFKSSGMRSAIRVVPVRDTNMGHMRDGFVRMVQAGGKSEGVEHEVAFEEALQGFRATMGGASKVGKGKVLLLARGKEGGLSVWAEGPAKEEASDGEMMYLGGVRDERIARFLWMGYLAGAKVATEGARESVVDGVLDLVERPIGTVETQVI